MLRMIVIDDEQLIRNGLTTYLDWEALGIEISAVCANGQEGLEAIRAFAPEIVLADISMPVMDGVTLLKESRKEGFAGQFIFISSYSEFRYAQEAVKYGAFEYLLKPLEAPVLEDCVRRCVSHIHSLPAPAHPQWDWALANVFFKEALMGAAHAEASLQAMLDRQELFYKSPSLAIGVWNEPPASQAAARQKLFAFLPPHCAASLLSDEGDAQALLRDFPEASWHIRPCGAKLHTHICQTLLSLWLARRGETDGALPLSPDAWQNELAALAEKALASGASLAACRELCREALDGLFSQVSRISFVGAGRRQALSLPLQHTENATNVYDLFEGVRAAGLRLLEGLHADGAVSPYTRKALAIIESQYGQSLSLGSIARSLGVSKSHLSATFKADMGCTFSDYLFEYRMKVAKALLEEGRYKIYEIGEKVGYPDMAQFSKRFKQYYSISPRDMQKIL
ncbi:MAG: response regulator [Clostridiales bacterium]|nr:response regulator [Clostridiales bacterium]